MEKLSILLSALILISTTAAMALPASSDIDSSGSDIQKNEQTIQSQTVSENENTVIEKQKIENESVKQTGKQGTEQLGIETKPASQADKDQTIGKETPTAGHTSIASYLSGLEIFMLSSATFYNDAAGMDIHLGIFTDMSLFGLTGYKKDIVLGGSGLWHRASKDDITVNTFGIYGIAGYQFFLKNYISGLRWYEDIRFMTQARIGAVDQNISGNGTSNGAAAFIAPALTADIKFTDIPIRLGLDVSYNIYMGDENLRSFSTGLYVSYRF